ncbi:putative tRNA pseudouridine synthase Pus10 [Copidosoma floridanum]|uniref:putative tRNA pseudouridine synthase Pus10 n=1 Tax=Copidosoma floridanum TaxID=29053 RepID=UPI0006C9A5E9|nr:putative tRNA pseudouridine synthase Pus10 [Copidosoma floridanum]
MTFIIEFNNFVFCMTGRYVKYSRRLPQTPWLVHGKYRTETSVQELICLPLLTYTRAESLKFLSSGREDVDVRMLAPGRPFAVELVNPKITRITQHQLGCLHEEIVKKTNKIQITNELKILAKTNLKILKQGEISKSKSYRALCICRKEDLNLFFINKLQTMKQFKIIQNTPVRVLHRRTLSPRERTIYEIRGRLAYPHELNSFYQLIKGISKRYVFIVIDLKTQAGTYIKEFVHGDFGRTYPNLCYLLHTEIDLIALDVTNISVKWP